MNPEYLNFAITPLYKACPHLRNRISIEDSQVKIINSDQDKGSLIIPASPYLWGIGVSLGDLLTHPPLLSGISQTLKEAIRFAEQFGFQNVDTSPSNETNKALIRLAKCDSPLVSKMKRQSGCYALAAWENHINYLIGNEPIFYSDHIRQEELPELILKYGNDNPYAAHWNGDFIRHYIRKREALRKMGAIAKSVDNIAHQVEFVHADHNECHGYTKKKDWQRHRIVKITDKYIFIDSYPFFGKAYLRQGWQARIMFMRTLNREIFERDGEYYHRTSRTTYYSEKTVRKRRWKCKLNDQDENIVIELPKNDLDWAINLLEIHKWPATIAIIKRAFVKKAMEHHPDRGGDAKEFIKCKTAREFLLDMCDA